MSETIEKLKALAQDWRRDEGGSKRRDAYEIGRANRLVKCADELESLISALEADFKSKGAAIAQKHVLLLQKDFDALNAAHQQDIINRRLAHQKEIQAFLEPMACGHPKACLRLTAYREGLPGETHYKVPSEPTCTACEHERLAVAAVHRTHADRLDKVADGYRKGGYSHRADMLHALAEETRALIPASDASLLDQHDAETRDRALEEAARTMDHEPKCPSAASNIRALKGER